MHSFLSTIISVIFCYCTPVVTAASADCFKQQGDSYTKPSLNATRVSAGLVCPESQKTNCSLESAGFVNAYSALNITTGAAAEVYDAVAKANNIEFVASIYGAVPNVTFNILPGQIGFAAFTVTNRCYAGAMESCVADISNGTAIEACQPTVLSGDNTQGVPSLDGTVTFVQSDRETVANMTTNPAENVTKDSPEVPSRAVKLGQKSAWSLIAMVAVGLAGGLVL